LGQALFLNLKQMQVIDGKVFEPLLHR